MVSSGFLSLRELRCRKGVVGLAVKKKNRFNIKATADKIVEILKREGFVILRYDAYSTKSVYAFPLFIGVYKWYNLTHETDN